LWDAIFIDAAVCFNGSMACIFNGDRRATMAGEVTIPRSDGQTIAASILGIM
jgi:hypothetical protein